MSPPPEVDIEYPTNEANEANEADENNITNSREDSSLPPEAAVIEEELEIPFDETEAEEGLLDELDEIDDLLSETP